jgi:hypothetical protein
VVCLLGFTFDCQEAAEPEDFFEVIDQGWLHLIQDVWTVLSRSSSCLWVNVASHLCLISCALHGHEVGVGIPEQSNQGHHPLAERKLASGSDTAVMILLACRPIYAGDDLASPLPLFSSSDAEVSEFPNY